MTAQDTRAGTRSGLRRFRAPAPPRPSRCELCGTELADRHRHLVDQQAQSLACSCVPCYLLFERPGAGGGRFRAVPGRWLKGVEDGVDETTWERLRIPVGVAFFFRNSVQERLVALYPSPAGATESELEPEEWEEALGGTGLARLLQPDVEALLLRRGDGGRSECYLVPVDAAYELVGRLRRRWQGFDGGAEAHAELVRFFGEAQERSARAPRPQSPEGVPQCRN